MPFTRKALENKNIRHELDQQSSCHETNQLSELVNQYEESKRKLKLIGINVDGIFDAEVDNAPVIRRHEEEEAQIEALVKKKKAFSAFGIYTNIGTLCVTSEAVLKAGRKQLEMRIKEKKKREEFSPN